MALDPFSRYLTISRWPPFPHSPQQLQFSTKHFGPGSNLFRQRARLYLTRGVLYLRSLFPCVSLLLDNKCDLSKI